MSSSEESFFSTKSNVSPKNFEKASESDNFSDSEETPKKSKSVSFKEKPKHDEPYEIIKNNGDLIISILDRPDYVVTEVSKEGIIMKKISDKGDVYDPDIHDLTSSKILKCNLNKSPIDKLKYASVLLRIYETIGKRKQIIKNTTFNMEKGQSDKKSYKYLESVDLSVEFKGGNNRTITEIIAQAKGNDLDFNMKIALESGNVISYSTK